MSISESTPTTIDQFQAIIQHALQNGRTVHVAGAQSKITPRSVDIVASTREYRGVTDHQASDFTITARAGTPVQEVCEILRSAGQHLPFDPTFMTQGATVGGLIATGLNGPCRLRDGGIRDFVIGLRYLDGHGRVVQSGGRVVKNAAGFDLPKFMVGSGGRFGIILEATWKVFPQPLFYRSFRFPIADLSASVSLAEHLAGMPDFVAVDILSDNAVLARVATQSETAASVLAETVASRVSPALEIVEHEAEHWQDPLAALCSQDSKLLIKVPLCRGQILQLEEAVGHQLQSRRFTSGGNAALLTLASEESLPSLDQSLAQRGLTGQVIVGPSDYFLLGNIKALSFLQRVKQAMDPQTVFGPLDPQVTATS